MRMVKMNMAGIPCTDTCHLEKLASHHRIIISDTVSGLGRHRTKRQTSEFNGSDLCTFEQLCTPRRGMSQIIDVDVA